MTDRSVWLVDIVSASKTYRPASSPQRTTIPAQVCSLVGAPVGNLVGTSVGNLVGSPVGSCVGCSVGKMVGSSVGYPVGCSVGSREGSVVGSGVGYLQVLSYNDSRCPSNIAVVQKSLKVVRDSI